MTQEESGGIKLGEKALYVDKYDPTLLEPIPRAASRSVLFGSNKVPFSGGDLWTSYELSWLDSSGKPHVAIAEFEFSYDSLAIVESKSFKYYLNSFNQTVFASRDEVKTVLEKDLSQAAEGSVKVVLFALDEYRQVSSLSGQCVDDLPLSVSVYESESALLEVRSDVLVQDQAIYSHLLKSNCPVTGQPDWASVWVKYSGAEILPESFLKYVVSFRKHQDFHENCVEKIFSDILSVCQPEMLTVCARYTRRGGLDINPYRTNTAEAVSPVRTARQ